MSDYGITRVWKVLAALIKGRPNEKILLLESWNNGKLLGVWMGMTSCLGLMTWVRMAWSLSGNHVIRKFNPFPTQSWSKLLALIAIAHDIYTNSQIKVKILLQKVKVKAATGSPLFQARANNCSCQPISLNWEKIPPVFFFFNWFN